MESRIFNSLAVAEPSVLEADNPDIQDIQYLEIPEEPLVVDANNLEAYHYNAAQDFALGGAKGMDVNMPVDGKVRVTGELEKLQATSDDITLVLLQNDEEVYTQEILWDQLGNIVLDHEIEVAKSDRLALHVRINSPIDLTLLHWNREKTLQLFYVESPDISPLTNEDGEPTVKMDFFYSYDIYPLSNLTLPLESWQVPKTDTYTIASLLALSPETSLLPIEELPQGTVVMTVKRNGELLAKYPVEIVVKYGSQYQYRSQWWSFI
ncbi:hypothetical protein BGS_1325 [Beggiatoa sp. SS]|nr:hypothetical protein BGS_1325 [Beggiatoa sp. SS]